MKKRVLGLIFGVAALVLAGCGGGETTTTTVAPTPTPTTPTPTTPEPTTPEPVFVAPTHISIIGSFNGWDGDVDLATSDEGHTWSIDNHFFEKDTEWKLRMNHTWPDGNNGLKDWGYSSVVEGKDLVSESGGNIKISTAGTYSIDFSYDNNAIDLELVEVYVPLAIEVSAPAESVYVTKTLQLSYSWNKENITDGVIWSTSNSEIASIDENGLVTANAAGEVTLTATHATNADITDSVTITVKDVALNVASATTNGATWNLDGLYSDNPVISVGKGNGDAFLGEEDYNTIDFKVSGRKYYAEATIKVSECDGWDWNRHGLVNKVVDTSNSRGFTYSLNSNKIILIENPNYWGAVTDSSQVWNFFNNDSFTDHKVGLLRDGNKFYYFHNDELIAVDSNASMLTDVDTIPQIVIVDHVAEISGIYATTDVTEIDNIVATRGARRFMPTYAENVIIDETAGTITFQNNTNLWPFDNCKDHAALSLYNSFCFPANTTGTLRFDVCFTDFGAENDNAFVGAWLKSTSNTEARSFMVNKYKFGMEGWGFNGNMTPQISVPTDLEETPVKAGQVYTVEVIRLADGAGWTMTFNGIQGQVWGWDAWNGSHNINLFAINCNAVISNISLTLN